MVGVTGGAGKLSQVLVDADLDMGAFNITLGAGQTVDGEDVGEITYEKIKAEAIEKVVSANKRHGVSDGSDETQITEDGWLIVKTFTFTHRIKGTLRFGYEYKRDAGVNAMSGRWYHNTTAIGTEELQGTNDVYEAESEDIVVDLAAGDTLSLKFTVTSIFTYPLCYWKNAQISYDNDSWANQALVVAQT